MASISSINEYKGLFLLHCLKKVPGPLPQPYSDKHFHQKSDPESVKKGTPALLLQNALANKVFSPYLEGPINKAPFGILPPNFGEFEWRFSRKLYHFFHFFLRFRPGLPQLSKVKFLNFCFQHQIAGALGCLPILKICPPGPLGPRHSPHHHPKE